LKEYHFKFLKRLCRYSVSFIVSIGLLAVVTVIMFYLIELRGYLYDRWQDEYYVILSVQIPVLINTLCIVIFNSIYSALALALTNYENHRTNTTYEASLIFKTWTF